jgi:hypothetical protein
VPAAVLALALVAAAAPAGGSPAPATSNEAYEAALRSGDVAFARRDDPSRLAEAIARYGEAVALRPDGPAALVALARAQAFRAQVDPSAAREAWRASSAAAERAVRVASPAFAAAVDGGADPGRAAAAVGAPGAEALYLLALATMGMAQERGMAAVLAVREAARGMMARAAELDERVDCAGPRRELGAWLAVVPSAAGGGAGAARAQLDRARALAPACQLTRVRDAETLAVLLQDRQRFERLLAEVLAFDEATAPAVAPENRLAKRRARDLLARRDRLF